MGAWEHGSMGAWEHGLDVSDFFLTALEEIRIFADLRCLQKTDGTSSTSPSLLSTFRSIG